MSLPIKKINSIQEKPKLAKKYLAKISDLPDANQALIIAKDLQEKGVYDASKALLAYEVGEGQDMQVKNYKDVFSSNVATLSTLKKYRGEGLCKMYLVTKFRRLAMYFKVNKIMEEEDLEMLADLILEDFYYLTIADIKYFSKNVIRGQYGKIYDRFDVPLVLEYLREYVDRRFRVAAEESKKEQNVVAKSKATIPMPDSIKKLIKSESVQKEKNIVDDFLKFKSEMQTFLNSEYNNLKKQLKENGGSKKTIPSFEDFAFAYYQKIQPPRP